ncbi:MAG: methionyl-tRNA formyltransferase [Candidatus Roizmanbacteria bacterium]
MKKLSIAYFGSPDFSARFLEKILTDQSINQLVNIKLVVTQPDRPVGRKQMLTPTPVKSIALKHDLEVFEIKDFNIKNSFKIKNLKLKIKELDLVMLYAYAGIIPEDFLNRPKHGFWCLHPSLLPKYRGTSPMATTLINGDRETGVTIIKMDEKIDHGPIIVQEKYTILPTDKRPDLEKKLTDLGFQLFVQSINRLDNIKFQNQDHSKASYTKKLTKQNGFLEFKNFIPPLAGSNSPEKLFNLFRGFYPWPGIWTLIQPVRLIGGSEKRLKITDMDLINGKLIIKKVQLEGKKEVDFETFKKAYKIF